MGYQIYDKKSGTFLEMATAQVSHNQAALSVVPSVGGVLREVWP